MLEGCGEMADAFHRTRSSPDGKPIIGCIRNALTDAGLKPEDIDYINAHGTGTPENDKMEYLGISSVFGERAAQIPVSSNKSMVGHTLSAAGAAYTAHTTGAYSRIREQFHLPIGRFEAIQERLGRLAATAYLLAHPEILLRARARVARGESRPLAELGAFFWRRVQRLWPVYFAIVLATET
mgnify:CR=1 FL=1